MKRAITVLWILIVLVIAAGAVRLIATRVARSPDQKILIDKSK